jgi:CheY-like chemotaxis protein
VNAKTIVLADDDADLVKLLTERCTRQGYSGVGLGNALDSILLDYNMPNGQGDYILGRLSDNPVTRNIPVIVVAGMRDKALERKMYGLGARRFFTKPVKFEALRDELANYIEILNVPA